MTGAGQEPKCIGSLSVRIGNVIGGLAHGTILVPIFGMPSTYLVAIASGFVSILLVWGTAKKQ